MDVPASIAGKRTRKFFVSFDAAKTAAEEYSESVLAVGVQAANEAGISCHDAMKNYLDAKKDQSARHVHALKFFGKRFQTEFGGRSLNLITISHLEQWLKKQAWGGRTKHNAISYLRAFFAYCQRRSLIASNPAGSLIEEMAIPAAKMEIVSVEEMTLLLRLTRRLPIMRAYIVFGGFAGIRTAEIQKLDWSCCDFTEKEIHIPAGVIKKTKGVRERYTMMTDAFITHIPQDGKGRVIPINKSNFDKHRAKLMARMVKVMTRLKIGNPQRWKSWPDNCMRHSFASYLMPIKRDAGRVAHELGHTSPAMVHQHYARAVKLQEAQKYWALAVPFIGGEKHFTARW